MKTGLIAAVILMTACGPSPSTPDAGAGGGTGGGSAGGAGGGSAGGGAGGGSAGGGAGGGSTLANLAVDTCTLLLSKDCPGAQNTPANQDACKQGYELAQARGCLPKIQAAYDCIKPSGVAGLVCMNNDVYSNQIACQEPLAYANFCRDAVLKPSCYGIACASSLDCPGTSACNTKTGHCVAGPDCRGLPCQSSLGCPSTQSCNMAIGQCVQ